MTDPTNTAFSFGEAREASSAAEREQYDAEQHLLTCELEYAHAEEAYRKALALKMWELRDTSDGGKPVAWTVVGDLARGNQEVARLKRIRDEAEGRRTIAGHAVYRRSADRRDLERLIDWSARRDLAEGNGERPGQQYARPTLAGARDAA